MGSFARDLNLIFNILGNENNNDNITLNECVETINHYSFYQYMLIPAILITISFGLSKQRRRLFLDYFNGRPGMVFPMDMMTRDTSISYAAAFAATLHLVFTVLFEQQFAFVNYGPPGLKSLIVVGSMIVYGMVFFPVFACLAIGSTYGYAIGSVYVWFFTALSTFQLFQCVHSYSHTTMILLVCRNIPQFVCLLYLCLSIPGRFVVSFKQHGNWFETIQDGFKTETLDDIKASYVGLHVINLLKRPKPKPEPPTGAANIIKATFWKFWNRWVYQIDDGFLYSSRFQSVMFVGVLLLYMLSFEILASGVTFLKAIIERIKQIMGESEQAESPLNHVYYFFDAIPISFILSVVITIFINLISILHMMSSYRKNLKDLHKGDHSHIPQASDRSNSSLLVGSIRYGGYQVGYIAWGFVIQFFIFFMIAILIAILVSLFKSGTTQWFYDLLMYAWPIILSAVIINVLQILLAKFIFLQDTGTHLAFENRRLLFSFTYFMFFYNIFLGLVSCLLRILKAIVLGALLLSRLDNSTLPHRFQFFDPGFAAYVGFMHVENSHNHPVVLVLVRIFLASCRTKVKSAFIDISSTVCTMDRVDSRGKNGSIEFYGRTSDDNRRREAAIFNWHVTYTLINNPELRLYRKGYLQALKKAKEQGVVMQVSDSLTTDPAFLVKPKKPVRTRALLKRKQLIDSSV